MEIQQAVGRKSQIFHTQRVFSAITENDYIEKLISLE